MTPRHLASFLLALTVLIVPSAVAAAGDMRITGPVTCDNLSIYLIHSDKPAAAKGYLTLGEGIAQHKVFVYETHGNQLLIENRSADQDLFVQSCEVVKGGDQDRTIEDDMVLAPESSAAIRCHCVEQGRGGPRGTENEHFFNASNNALASRELKLANYADDQQGVWSSVAAMQTNLASNVNGFGGQPDVSPTSFELTLESPQVTEAVRAYVNQLKDAREVASNGDVIGFAMVINGKLSGADLYASNALFLKLWPKLLTAASVEAISNKRAGSEFTAPTTDAIATALADMQNGIETHSMVIDRSNELTTDQKAQLAQAAPSADAKPLSSAPSDRLSFVKRETDTAVEYETRDSKTDAAFVHRAYLSK
jgi:hypothetical protein